MIIFDSSDLSKGRTRLKAVLHALFAIVISAATVSLESSVALSQPNHGERFNGRWVLTIQTDQRIIEQPVDLRVEASGTSRLVLLGPVNGEDGLFRGSFNEDRFDLAGRLHGREARITLSPLSSTLIGELETGFYRAQLSARQTPLARSEVIVKDYPKVLEGVWKGVQENFYDPNLNGVDWNSVRRKYFPLVRASRNDGELVVSLRRMLRELKSSTVDFHLSTGGPVTRLTADRVAWKELSPSVGYLAIRAFSADDLYSFDSNLDKAMDSIGAKHNIILDLRGNRGENLESALGALNILLPEARPVAFFVTREGLTSLGATSIDTVDPSKLPAAFADNPTEIAQFKGAGMYLAGGKYKRPFTGRYVVLIDELCSGSCELFAEALREAGVADLIGRRTPGTLSVSHSVTFTFVQWFRLLKHDVSGWKMTLPMMEIRTAGKKRIDGAGIEPDLQVDRSGGQDADLAAALKWLGR